MFQTYNKIYKVDVKSKGSNPKLDDKPATQNFPLNIKSARIN